MTWEAKVVAVADAAETNWKHEVTPDWGEFMRPFTRQTYMLKEKKKCRPKGGILSMALYGITWQLLVSITNLYKNGIVCNVIANRL